MQLPESPTKLSWVHDLKCKIMGDIYDLEGLRLGKVLTIIDAVIMDKDQNKAVKDLVRNAFYEKEMWTTYIQGYLIRDIEKNTGKVNMDVYESSLWKNILSNFPAMQDENVKCSKAKK